MLKPFYRRTRRPVVPRRGTFVGLEALEARDVPAIFSVGSIQNFGTLLNNNGSVATADLDNDGKLDLVLSNYGSSKAPNGSDDPGNSITVMFGNGSGGFSNAANYATGGAADFVSFVAIGDLNADGFNDIVSVQTGTTASGSQSSFTVFLNTGIGTFTSVTTVTNAANATWVGVADLNGDTVNDIAITHLGRDNGGGIDGNNVSIYFGNKTSNKADGTFSLSNTYGGADFTFIPTAGTFVDFDNDGDLDIAVTIPNAPPDDVSPQVAGKIGLLTNTLGAFSVGTTFPGSGGPLPISIVATDLNNDGKKDLLVANAGDPDVDGFYLNFGAGSNASRLLGDGFGNFGAAVGQTTGVKSAFAVAAGDFNLDGNADMAALSYGSPLFTNGALVIYLGNGAGSFVLDNTYTDTSAGLQYLAVGDFDGKGNVDIASVGDVNRIRSYLNSTRPTTTTLNASTNNASAGTNITFTATTAITGGYAATPAGTVNFYDGTSLIGSGTLALTGGEYKASFSTTGLSVGSHSITAKYMGQFVSGPFTGVSTSTAQSVTITGASNTPPSIGDVTDKSVTAGVTAGPYAFTVGDAETAVGSLTLSAQSSNTGVIPLAAINFGGSGVNRTISINTSVVGSSIITITVTDGGGLTAQDTFLLTVNAAANTNPTISDITDKSTSQGIASGPHGFIVGDAETPVGSLTVSGTSSNQSLVPDGNIFFGGSGANRTILINPAAGQSGTATITVTVTDGGGLTAQDTFVLTVTAPNTPPTISDITDKSTNINVASGPHAFTIGDAETAVGSLTLSGSSNNTTLVPNGNIFFGGSGANRTVLVSPAAGQTGTATITVTVTDGGGLTAQDTFILTVTDPNTPPTISDVGNQNTITGVAVGPIGFTIGDAETAAGSLTLSKSSNNTTLVPTANIVFSGSGANRFVTVTPAAGQTGTATITIFVTDGGGLQASDSFDLVVSVPPNTPPTISDITDKSTPFNTPGGPYSFTIGDAETPLGSLTLSATSSNTTAVPVSNIVFGGSSASRTVTITPAAGQSGTSTITVFVTDGGGLQASDSFVFTVQPNTAPTISDITNRSIQAGTSTGAIAFTVGDAETPAGSLVIFTSSSDLGVIPLANITLGGSGANRTVSVLAPAGVSGTSTITVTVSDGNLQTFDTFDVEVTLPPNTNPTISDIADRTTPQNTATGLVAFTVGDTETAPGALTLSALSSDPTLVPVANVVFGGSGANRTLNVTPAAGKFGTATITVTVTDGGGKTASDLFVLTVLPTPAGRAREFAIASDIGLASTVRFFNPDHTERFTLQPFGAAFTGGIRTASADFNGDDIADLVVGSGPGMPGTVRVIDGVTTATLFEIQPFGASFTRGVVVSAGDMSKDGKAELCITAESGGGARVRIFTPGAGGFTQLADFFAIIGGDGVADTKFRGGGRSAVGDFDGDGFGDFAFAAGTGGGPRIAIFDGETLVNTGNQIKMRGDFFAFEPALRNGTYISAGDMDGDGRAELACGAGPGGGPRVSIFDGEEMMAGKEVKLKDFFAGDVNNRGGIRVAVKNIDGDIQGDLLVGAGPGGGSRVTSYLGAALLAGPNVPAPAFDFDAFPGFGGGVYVG